MASKRGHAARRDTAERTRTRFPLVGRARRAATVGRGVARNHLRLLEGGSAAEEPGPRGRRGAATSTRADAPRQSGHSGDASTSRACSPPLGPSAACATPPARSRLGMPCPRARAGAGTRRRGCWPERLLPQALTLQLARLSSRLPLRRPRPGRPIAPPPSRLRPQERVQRPGPAPRWPGRVLRNGSSRQMLWTWPAPKARLRRRRIAPSCEQAPCCSARSRWPGRPCARAPRPRPAPRVPDVRTALPECAVGPVPPLARLEHVGARHTVPEPRGSGGRPSGGRQTSRHFPMRR